MYFSKTVLTVLVLISFATLLSGKIQRHETISNPYISSFTLAQYFYFLGQKGVETDTYLLTQFNPLPDDKF